MALAALNNGWRQQKFHILLRKEHLFLHFFPALITLFIHWLKIRIILGWFQRIGGELKTWTSCQHGVKNGSHRCASTFPDAVGKTQLHWNWKQLHHLSMKTFIIRSLGNLSSPRQFPTTWRPSHIFRPTTGLRKIASKWFNLRQHKGFNREFTSLKEIFKKMYEIWSWILIFWTVMQWQTTNSAIVKKCGITLPLSLNNSSSLVSL